MTDQAAAGVSLTQISKIFKTITKLSGAISSATTLYEFLTGDTPTDRIVDAIEELETAVVNELKAIQKELENQDWQDQWQPFKTAINDVQTSVANISSEFSTVKQVDNGYVIISSSTIPFDQWATESSGPGQTEGALDQLWQDMNKIWDLFQTGGIADSSMLDIWGKLFELGTSDDIQNFSGQHRLSAYFLLLQQINGIISQIFFLHEAILGLYVLHYGNKAQKNSLSDQVKEWFGSYSAENTVWNKFDQVMTFDQKVFDDFNYISTAVDSYSVNDSPDFVRMADPGDPCGSYIWTKEFSVQDLDMTSLSITNAFITDIRLVNAANSSPGWPQIYLEGTVSTMEAGGGIKTVGDYSSYISNATPGNPNLTQFPFPGYANNDGGWYVNTGYSVPGRANTPNSFNVVTGFNFGIWTHGPNTTYYESYLVIKVQSATLDVSDIENPTVTGFSDFIYNGDDPSGFGLFDYTDTTPATVPPHVEFWNLNSAGNAAGFPIDDLSLARVHNAPYQWNGNEVGILARSNFTIHQADFMQPVNSLVPFGFKPPKDS